MNLLQNPAIQKIKDNKRWTISDINKAPLSFVSLVKRNKVEGAYSRDETCLASLEEVMTYPFKDPKYAYFLRSDIDKICVLDIEPSCPEETKKWLLSVPYLYAERSLSGKGYHLILPLPEKFEEYPNFIKNKVSLQKKPHYEILLEHFVTFTGDEIDLSHIKRSTTVDEIFEELIKNQKNIEKTNKVKILDDISLNNIPKIKQIMETIETNIRQFYPEDYTHPDGTPDMSLFEFSFACHILHQTKRILKLRKFSSYKYNSMEIITISAKILEKRIEYRPKHSQLRYGLPWLLWDRKQLHKVC